MLRSLKIGVPLGFIAVAVVASAAWVLFRPAPTPLPLHLLEACLGAAPAKRGQESYATIRSETRIAVERRTPWRCEVPFTPALGSVLTLAAGVPNGSPDVPIRVSFDPWLGPSKVLHEGSRKAAESLTAWEEIKIDLHTFSKRPGRVVLETDPAASDGLPFFIADPIAFVPAADTRENLVLILLDTLRADRVGFNGYERPTTPHLDELAKQGTVFTHAYSPTSVTRPSTAALLTGVEPFVHRVYGGTGRIPPNLPTLASILREAGYITSAISRNPNVLPIYGFNRGFQKFVDAESRDWGRATDVTLPVDLALAELDRIRHQPFFLYLHINQIHAPYAPPDEYVEIVAGEEKTPSDFYDGDIRFTDVQLGRLWERIRSLGLEDRTLLTVVADHGEEFGEHGGGGHGSTLYEEVLRIPFFIRLPGKVPAGKRIDRMVRLVEVMPTLLELLQTEHPLSEARSLLAEPVEQGASGMNPFYYVLEESVYNIHAVRDGRWKYIATIRPGAVEELYDLEQDPGEQRNLISIESAQGDRLAGLLKRQLTTIRPGLHVRVVSSSGEPRRLRVRLRTNGRFDNIWKDSVEGEHGDLVRISQGKDMLEMVANVANTQGYKIQQALPEPKLFPLESRQPDLDEMGFTLEPPDSRVDVEILPEDTVTGTLQLRVGHRSLPLKGSFDANDPALSMRVFPTLEVPGAGTTVWIYSIAGGSKVEGPIPEEIQERLRALGYVD